MAGMVNEKSSVFPQEVKFPCCRQPGSLSVISAVTPESTQGSGLTSQSGPGLSSRHQRYQVTQAF